MIAFTRVSRIVSSFRHMAAPNCEVVRRQSLASYPAEFCAWPRVAPSTSLSSASDNKRFPEITGEDNLTVFSYSGIVKCPEWRWQRRRADLRHFEIFRHGPIIIYTRLPAGGTYYPICTFPASRECLIGISDAFSALVYGYPSSSPRAHCTPNKSVPTLRYTRRNGSILLYRSMPEGSYRVQSPGFPKIVYY